ncbi:MAG: (deoxy)nucleoside triphosphate pyrophosphohydrolase [Kofleriaceae bacterium]
MSDRKRMLVVAGLVVRDGRILITQRGPVQNQPELALKWEFPGGKVEPGEAPVDALIRELREEIGVTVEVGRIWEVLFHAYPGFDLVMLVFACTIVPVTSLGSLDAEPRPLEVHDLAWVTAGELAGWDILPADRPLVERLRTEGLPEVTP